MGWTKVDVGWMYERPVSKGAWGNSIWIEGDGRVGMSDGPGVSYIELPEDVAIFQLLADEPITEDALRRDGWRFVPYIMGEIDQSFWTTEYKADKQVIVEFREGGVPKVFTYAFMKGIVEAEYCVVMEQLNVLVQVFTDKFIRKEEG